MARQTHQVPHSAQNLILYSFYRGLPREPRLNCIRALSGSGQQEANSSEPSGEEAGLSAHGCNWDAAVLGPGDRWTITRGSGLHFLLPPYLHLHSIPFIFHTVKNSISTRLKPSATIWHCMGLNKGRIRGSSVSWVNWSWVLGWKHQNQTTNSFWFQPQVPQEVGKAILGAAGHLLLLLVLPMEHSEFGFWAGSSRLLRLYASIMVLGPKL